MMEREDLIRLANEALARFKPPPTKEAYRYGVLTTSGTSGTGALVRLIELEREKSSAYVEEWQRGNEHILIAYGSLCTRLLQMLALRKAGDGARGVALDSADLRAELGPLLEDLTLDRLVGGPSFILRIAEHMSVKTREGIASLRCAGERLSASQRELLSSAFPHMSLDVTYTSIETGTISKPLCGYLPPNHYHVRDEVEVAVVNADEDGTGDILVSIPGDRIIPIKQYRIGDAGRLSETACPCGEPLVLEVLGRRGLDYIKLAGAILRQEEFDRATKVIDMFDDYRAEALDCIDGGKHKGKVILRVFGARASEQEIAERFSHELYMTPMRTLADLIDEGHFVPLIVERVTKPFSQLNKEIKLRRAD